MFRFVFHACRLTRMIVILAYRVGLPLLHMRRHRGSDDPRMAAAMQALVATLHRLGPSYIKLGQFLATRPDLIGMDWALALMQLQDRLPPFGDKAAAIAIEKALGRPVTDWFASFSAPIAAASIAQVHRAEIRGDGAFETAAVKVLRPRIERRLMRDLATMSWAAAQIERFSPSSRRLRPRAAIANMRATTVLEMDLRLEAAALLEMAENRKEEARFRVPRVDWPRTARRVLTLEWIDGVPLRDRDRLIAADHDLSDLATRLVQLFLRQVVYDGFFHADLHGGNVIVEADGTLVLFDCGIMGRLKPIEQRFFGEILYGFLVRDYTRIAEIHRDAGYVPRHHSTASFAQALRAIGEPIAYQSAAKISMARLLQQLFDVTGYYDMQMQPQLLLLQKTMVVVEGSARHLDADFNIWDCAAPVLAPWYAANLAGELPDQAREASHALYHLATRIVIPSLPEIVETLSDNLTNRTPDDLDNETPSQTAPKQWWYGFMIGAMFGAGAISWLLS